MPHLDGPEEIGADGDHSFARLAAPVDDAAIAHPLQALPPQRHAHPLKGHLNELPVHIRGTRH